MMFLLYFVWGSWYGQMSKYMFTQLDATGQQVGNAYAAFSIAMIIAPFFVGMIADRYFAAQKVLGVLSLAGSAVLFYLTSVTDANIFFWGILVYCITFAPTMALTTSIAMQQVQDSEKDFPAIRVMGTVAWIVVSNIIGFYGFGDNVMIFKISMVTSALLGVYSFFLPNTPPKPSARGNSFSDILGLDAFTLFRDRSFTIFFISSLLICIPLSFYYAMANPSLTDAGMTNVENKMSLGQASEVVFMLLIPLAFRKWGVKWMLIVGLIAWVIRFIGFGYGDVNSEWLLYLAIILHGVCYDFFFVTGQIYTDSKAGEKYRSSAQGLISIATYGIGMGIGSWMAGLVADMYTIDGVKNWTSIWMVPAGITAVVLVLFVLFFKDNKIKAAN